MISLQECLKRLQALPSNIFSTDNWEVTYRGTIVLTGSRLTTYCPTEAGRGWISHSLPTETLSDRIKVTTFILEKILLLELPTPTAFFKNGKVRLSTLSSLNYNTTGAAWQTRSPLMLKLQEQIKHNWSTLPLETKQKLSSYCDENGNIICLKDCYILEAGRSVHRRINILSYKVGNNFINSRLGTIYIPKDSPKLYRATFQSEVYEFTQEEWAWFTLYHTQCTSCDNWTTKEDTVFGLCSHCTTLSSLSLESYSTRATEKFEALYTKSHKHSPHLLGVELEYEQKPNTILKETLFLLHKNLKSHAIFKRDGSLRNGVEICTRPASIDIHLEELSKFYADTLIWERLEVKDSCGMHIHIDRRKMSALSLGKLINFVQQKENQSFIETIAERTANSYAQLGNDLSVTSFHRGIASTQRYLGMNTQNKDTAELRIFKTPSTFESFQKNMEFASALTSFVQPANSGIKDTNYEAFLNYVKSNSNTYKELFKFNKKNF